VDPVPDPLLLRKSGGAGNRTRDLCVSSQKGREMLSIFGYTIRGNEGQETNGKNRGCGNLKLKE
jgi:hypothetical protein